MKNPWMSAWLSAANSVVGASRGRMLAEMQKNQSRLIHEWQCAWVEMWFGLWFPGVAEPKAGARKRR